MPDAGLFPSAPPTTILMDRYAPSPASIQWGSLGDVYADPGNVNSVLLINSAPFMNSASPASASPSSASPASASYGETPTVMGQSSRLDPREQAILDIVHSAESRSRSGADSYNVIYGYNEGHLSRPVTEMTVQELLGEMPTMVRRFGGSASGRYQFIRSTLQEMVDLGLADPNRRFDAGYQDELAIARMRQVRHLDAFMGGEMSARDFAHHLSQEWAGLPNPNTGRSFYDGYAGNRSTIGLDYVQRLQEVQRMNPIRPQPNGRYNAFDLASSFMGMTEGADHEAIGQFISRGIGQELDPRETVWCAAFVNAVLAHQGLPITEYPLWSLSFLEYGTPTDTPQVGDIVALNRGPDGADYGHVGFFAGFDSNGNIRVLGGNQSNGVNIQSYSRDALAGFRDISGLTADDMQRAVNDSIEQSSSPIARQQAVRTLRGLSTQLFERSLTA